MNKFCIIGVYFGKLPNYFNLWLKSCEYNPTIDFYIITDQKRAIVPQNVKWITCTLNELKTRISKELGFLVSLDRPYKCCDYRPMFGLVFKDYLKGYDYWGHCDFDMIFGDLQCFFDKYNIYKYDKFLTLGHLSMYRNAEYVNNAFKLKGGKYYFKEVCGREKNCLFDELSGIYKIFIENGLSVFNKYLIADIATGYSRYRIIEEYPLDIPPANFTQQIFYWENGKVFRDYYHKGIKNTDEYMYIHFQKRTDYIVKFNYLDINAFYITCDGFVEKMSTTSVEDINKYNKYNKGKEIFESVKKQCKKRIDIMINIICRIIKKLIANNDYI